MCREELESISRENITALDHGWSLAWAQENLNLMVSFIYSSMYHCFIHHSLIHSFNKRFGILLLCPRYFAGFRVEDNGKKMQSAPSRRLQSSVGIRHYSKNSIMHAHLPAVPWKHTAACDQRTCSGPGSEEALVRGWASAETWGMAGINMTKRQKMICSILCDASSPPLAWPYHLDWAHVSAPCMTSGSQTSFPTFFSAFASSCFHCP